MVTITQLWIAGIIVVAVNFIVQKLRKGATPERRADIALDTAIAIAVFCAVLTLIAKYVG